MTKTSNYYSKLQSEVINQGLCTHCGLCAGMSANTLKMTDTPSGPLPSRCSNKAPIVNHEVFQSCPGKGINYPKLNKLLFNKLPDSWLVGNFLHSYIGHSTSKEIRRIGASGGLITHVCLYLLDKGLVDGIIMSRMRSDIPWQPETIIATTSEQIKSCAQSIYQPIPVLEIINQLKKFTGKVAMVGLPDQVGAVRSMQTQGNLLANKISFIIGPYVGTNMYFESIKSFLRSNGVSDFKSIKKLNYRDGEWPGYLSITLKNGRRFTAEKFYYNYLIPFFITRSSLTSIDLTNELTDISVGDAWNPTYEKKGQGFSVVIARSKRGLEILKEMKINKLISLNEIDLQQTIKMHAHMIEFKKRGAFIRLKLRKFFSLNSPEYGYKITNIPLVRIVIELIISGIFAVCKLGIVKKIMELIPIKILGKVFNFIRINWKKVTKSSKRKGLVSFTYEVE